MTRTRYFFIQGVWPVTLLRCGGQIGYLLSCLSLARCVCARKGHQFCSKKHIRGDRNSMLQKGVIVQNSALKNIVFSCFSSLANQYKICMAHAKTDPTTILGIRAKMKAYGKDSKLFSVENEIGPWPCSFARATPADAKANMRAATA